LTEHKCHLPAGHGKETLARLDTQFIPESPPTIVGGLFSFLGCAPPSSIGTGQEISDRSTPLRFG
jgi:hypothetical protein